MNNKSIVLESIYEIEEAECNSGLDTIVSMIEASDKAYSIIKEYSTDNDEIYDMFAIFQEDGEMDPDQHGKKISDMNEKEKKAYREKHAFKEDSTFMTILKFIPNLIGLIIRSIGKLFKKKEDLSFVQKAIDKIQNLSPDLQAAAAAMLDGLYESIGGNDDSEINILGIKIKTGLISSLVKVAFGALFATAVACRKNIKAFFVKIFKKKGESDNVKYGLKFKKDKESGKWHWESDINLTAIEEYTNAADAYIKSFAQNVTNPIKSSSNVEKDKYTENKKTLNEAENKIVASGKKGMTKIEMSSSDLINSLEKIINRIGTNQEQNTLINDLGVILQDLNNEDFKKNLQNDQYKEFLSNNNLTEDIKDLSENLTNLGLSIRSMVDHIKSVTEEISSDSFRGKLGKMLTGNGLTKALGEKLLHQREEEFNDAPPAEKTEETIYQVDDDEDEYVEDASVTSIPADESELAKYKFFSKEQKSLVEAPSISTYFDDAETGEDRLRALHNNNIIVVKKKETPKEENPQDNTEPEKLKEESFVDDIDEDSEYISEQASRWYSR